MNETYVFKSLENISYQQICSCLNLAFSDYALPIQLDEQAVQKLFELQGISRIYSFGAFRGGEMVGFILNTVSTQNGEEVVFDAATGIIPECRGNKVFSRLFEYVEEKLRAHHVKKYYLEVLQENQKSIQIYTDKGFHKTRGFVVLRSPAQYINKVNDAFVYDEPYSVFDLENTRGCTVLKPSFEHTKEILNRHKEEYRVMYHKKEDHISAWCVYSLSNNLLQFGYNNVQDLEVILTKIISRGHPVNAKNIDLDAVELIGCLKKLGFEEITRQYEMLKIL